MLERRNTESKKHSASNSWLNALRSSEIISKNTCDVITTFKWHYYWKAYIRRHHDKTCVQVTSPPKTYIYVELRSKCAIIKIITKVLSFHNSVYLHIQTMCQNKTIIWSKTLLISLTFDSIPVMTISKTSSDYFWKHQSFFFEMCYEYTSGQFHLHVYAKLLHAKIPKA